MKKTLLEQELTKEQVEWLKSHADHDETNKVIIGARVADWSSAEGKEKRTESFKKTCESFRKWWMHENLKTKFIITPLRDLLSGDNSIQYRMSAKDNYVDFATLGDELCAHTWQCPGQGREFLKALEEYAKNVQLKLTIPTVLNIKLEYILRDNGYTMKEVPYMNDVCELWSKDA